MYRIGSFSLSFLLFFLHASVLSAQTSRHERINIKSGTFYFYPAGSKEKYKIIRSGSGQTEIDLTTRDTSFLNITWETDSLFTVKFRSGTKKMSENQALFFQTHVMVFKVLTITPAYYTFLTALDSINAEPSFRDTLWCNPWLKIQPVHKNIKNHQGNRTTSVKTKDHPEFFI